MIPIDKIVLPADVRADWEQLEMLEHSLRTTGQLQAIGVKPQGDLYQLLWGHNRLQAAKNIGWQEIRAAICDYADDDPRRELVVLEENLIRDELTHLEYAEALGRQREIYLKLYPKTGHGKGRLKQHPTNGSCAAPRPAFLDEKASQLGWSRSKVGNHVYLYRHLPVEVRDLIRTHAIADNFTDLYDLAHEDAPVQLAVARLLHDEPQMTYQDALKQAAPHVVEAREDRAEEKRYYPGKGQEDDLRDDLHDLHDEEQEDDLMADGDTETARADTQAEHPADASATYSDPLRKAIDDAKELCSPAFFDINTMIKQRQYFSLDHALHKIESWLDRFVVDSPYGLYVDRSHNTVSITFNPFTAPESWTENHPEGCPGWRLFNPKEKVCKGCWHQKACFTAQVLPENDKLRITQMEWRQYNWLKKKEREQEQEEKRRKMGWS